MSPASGSGFHAAARSPLSCSLFSTLALALTMTLAMPVAGCRAPAPADIVDVRPTTVQQGDTMVVEGRGFVPGGETVVLLEGKLRRNRGPEVSGEIRVPARVLSPTMVAVDAAGELRPRLGVHTRFTGRVSVEQRDPAGVVRRLTAAPGEVHRLDLLPQTLSQLGQRAAPGPGPLAGYLRVAVVLGFAVIILAFIFVLAGLLTVVERRIAGRMQSRIGPNRVGPQGALQWLADGLKLILKEDLVPAEADPALFRISPYLVFIGLFGTLVVLPFSQLLIVADLNIGVLYLLAITALVVVGIIMGGWASNSKWSLFGAMRSAAQILSYEVPSALALLSVAVLAGTLAPQKIVEQQGGWPWQWFVFDNPFVFACFFIYFISALAEGNRTPFDLPEAESELVSGFNTEYSGFRFAVYFLAEWANLYVIGAIATALFLGGWQIPGVEPRSMEISFVLQALGLVIFFLKALGLVFVIMWVRWTLPRIRVDQMMSMCWKYFIPATFVCFLGVALWVWLIPDAGRLISRVVMFVVLGIGLAALFASRVVYNLRATRAEIDLNPFP